MEGSDGLAGDFTKLCSASGVAADIDVGRVPFSDAAKAVIAADPGALESAVTGGDDYQIVCIVPAAKTDSFRAAARGGNVAGAGIGEVKAGEGARFLAADAEAPAFKRASFMHF